MLRVVTIMVQDKHTPVALLINIKDLRLILEVVTLKVTANLKWLKVLKVALSMATGPLPKLSTLM